MMLAPFIARLHSRVRLWVLAAVGAFFGILPDLVALVGFGILRDKGGLWFSAHGGQVSDVLQYIPMYALHIAIDSLTRDPEQEWHGLNVRVWVQVVLWLLNISVGYWFYRIWRRNVRSARQCGVDLQRQTMSGKGEP